MIKNSIYLIFFSASLMFFTLMICPNRITSLPLSQTEDLFGSGGAVEVLPEIFVYQELPDVAETSFPTAMGNLVYYTQHDMRWAGYLYGGSDPLYKFGCGPTVLSMIVTSFTDKPMNPAEMAAWSYEHSYWAPASGSFHSLISGGLSEFGLCCESVSNRSAQNIVSRLESGQILIALMDSGHFTQSGGHFIILTGISSDGRICVADPNNTLLTNQTWDPALISAELRKEAGFGGPLWSVSR